MVYVGVDIALSRPQHIIVVDENLTIAEIVQRPDAASVAEYIADHSLEAWVAIDGPRRLNKCLMADEQYHAQLQVAPRPGVYRDYRVCEYEICRRNINCSNTPHSELSLSPGRQWMKVAFDLYDALHKKGFKEFKGKGSLTAERLMLEYFPYASFSVMAEKYPGKKDTPEGRRIRVELLRDYGVDGDLAILTVDQLDALVGAVTAHALHQGKATWVGDKGEGLLVVPGKLLDTYGRPRSR